MSVATPRTGLSVLIGCAAAFVLHYGLVTLEGEHARPGGAVAQPPAASPQTPGRGMQFTARR